MTGSTVEAPGDCIARSPGLQILVVLRNEVARWGLCSMLHTLPTVAGVRGCDDVSGALPLFAEHRFDVVITSVTEDDEEFDRLSGEASRQGARVLLLLRESDDQHVARAAVLPSDGFLLESQLTPSTLDDALFRLIQGEMPIPSSLARSLLAQLRRRGRGHMDRPFLLTPREQQALALLAEGLSNKQIARRLGISEHGAKRHVANVLAKLNCPNRTLAVALALRDGLLTDV